MAAAVSEAVAGRHFQVWSADPREEAQLGGLDVTGDFKMPTIGTPTVTLNGFTANRAGYFVSSDVQTVSSTDDVGRTMCRTTITLVSRAPTRPPSILLGIRGGDVGGKPLGTFGTDINVYLSEGVTVTAFEVGGKRVVPFEWNELGSHVVSWSTFVEPGKSLVVNVSYRTGSP
jgi:hypothetical protein